MHARRRSSSIPTSFILILAVLLVILLALIITNAAGLWSGDPGKASGEQESTGSGVEAGSSRADGTAGEDDPETNGGEGPSGGNPSGEDSGFLSGEQGSGIPSQSDSPAQPAGDSYDEIANYWANSGVELVPYDGVVEHIFFHPTVAYAELAFDGDYQSDGIDDWMVTAGEYQLILESLYANDFILVDINAVWSEVSNGNGGTVMKRNTLYIPEGKKPLIISYDDVNYYDYMRENGFVYKLILDEEGNIAAWGLDPAGNEVVSYDLDIVTIMDAFVAEHPDFSLNGAKGCLGLTGYEGILGYRTQSDSPNRTSEIEAVKPVIERLKETGWTFASHTYGHISMTNCSYERIVSDTEKWLDEVGSLIGDTAVLLYPYGARVDENDGAAFQYLQSKGFRFFISVGIEPYINNHTNSPAVCGDRMHPDGTTLRWNRQRYMRFYDAAEIMDVAARPDRGYDW